MAASVGRPILLLPAQALDRIIFRVARTGCFTVGKPLPLQAAQLCSLIFGVMVDLSGRVGGFAGERQ